MCDNTDDVDESLPNEEGACTENEGPYGSSGKRENRPKPHFRCPGRR
jgi:hypothetical protein